MPYDEEYTFTPTEINFEFSDDEYEDTDPYIQLNNMVCNPACSLISPPDTEESGSSMMEVCNEC